MTLLLVSAMWVAVETPMQFTRGVEIAKIYTCSGQVICYKLKGIVHIKFYLSHIEEQIMHKDLSEALTVIK